MNQPSRTHSDAATLERIEFVRAEGSDLECVLDLIHAYYEFDGIAYDAESVRRGLRILLADHSLGGAWLIRKGSVDVGYFIMTFGFDLEFGGRQATVTELYLRAEHRREGIGTATLRFIEEHLRQLGIEAYELQVERDNAEARSFYMRSGFEAHDRIPLSKRIAPRR